MSLRVLTAVVVAVVLLLVGVGVVAPYLSGRQEVARLRAEEGRALEALTAWTRRETADLVAAGDDLAKIQAIQRAAGPYKADLRAEHAAARQRRLDGESAHRTRFGWLP